MTSTNPENRIRDNRSRDPPFTEKSPPPSHVPLGMGTCNFPRMRLGLVSIFPHTYQYDSHKHQEINNKIQTRYTNKTWLLASVYSVNHCRENLSWREIYEDILKRGKSEKMKFEGLEPSDLRPRNSISESDKWKHTKWRNSFCPKVV